jgi:hypothetical protein
MIARARALLARYEELWRSRIDRLDAILAEPGSAEAAAHPPTESDPTSTQGE